MAVTRIDLLSKKEDQCDMCKYYVALLSLEESEQRSLLEQEIYVGKDYMKDYGKCRRYPPVFHQTYKNTPTFRFPRINGSNWCGEFKQRQ